MHIIDVLSISMVSCRLSFHKIYYMGPRLATTGGLPHRCFGLCVRWLQIVTRNQCPWMIVEKVHTFIYVYIYIYYRNIYIYIHTYIHTYTHKYLFDTHSTTLKLRLVTYLVTSEYSIT